MDRKLQKFVAWAVVDVAIVPVDVVVVAVVVSVVTIGIAPFVDAVGIVTVGVITVFVVAVVVVVVGSIVSVGVVKVASPPHHKAAPNVVANHNVCSCIFNASVSVMYCQGKQLIKILVSPCSDQFNKKAKLTQRK